jgi:hypothetical protein
LLATQISIRAKSNVGKCQQTQQSQQVKVTSKLLLLRENGCGGPKSVVRSMQKANDY